MLIGGLMSWIGNRPPIEEDLSGHTTVSQAQIHIRSIQETGGVILGCRALHLENIEPALFLSETPGPKCLLMRGYEILRPATPEEQAQLPVWHTWGYLVIQQKAEELAKNAV